MAGRITAKIRSSIDELSKINQYHVKMLAHLIDKLPKPRTATGRCWIIRWCSTAATWGTPISMSTTTCRTVLVGGLNGKLKGGRHLAYPTKTVPTGNLLLSLLDMYDIHQDSIGDSTGRPENL